MLLDKPLDVEQLLRCRNSLEAERTHRPFNPAMIRPSLGCDITHGGASIETIDQPVTIEQLGWHSRPPRLLLEAHNHQS
jgi:hypothetical protein